MTSETRTRPLVWAQTKSPGTTTRATTSEGAGRRSRGSDQPETPSRPGWWGLRGWHGRRCLRQGTRHRRRAAGSSVRPSCRRSGTGVTPTLGPTCVVGTTGGVRPSGGGRNVLAAAQPDEVHPVDDDRGTRSRVRRTAHRAGVHGVPRRRGVRRGPVRGPAEDWPQPARSTVPATSDISNRIGWG